MKKENQRYLTLIGLNKLSKEINEDVKEMGFENNDIPLRIALIHSEISEAFEAFRNDNFCKIDHDHKKFLERFRKESIENSEFTLRYKQYFEAHIKNTFEDEIADSIIRLIDLCGEMEIDIEYHIKQKLLYNKSRGYKFGGKKF